MGGTEREWGWGRRLFEFEFEFEAEGGGVGVGANSMLGAYSRWALIRGWVLIRKNTVHRFQLVSFSNLRACLRGGGGPQVGEVTLLGGVTRLSI